MKTNNWAWLIGAIIIIIIIVTSIFLVAKNDRQPPAEVPITPPVQFQIAPEPTPPVIDSSTPTFPNKGK